MLQLAGVSSRDKLKFAEVLEGGWGRGVTVSSRCLQITFSPILCNRAPGQLSMNSRSTVHPQDYRCSGQILINTLHDNTLPPALSPSPQQHSPTLSSQQQPPPRTPACTTSKTPSSPCKYLQEYGWGSQGGMVGWRH